ncbi:MAG: DHH family phosphoesterase [Candidatus Hydrogenedentota bacterium]
MTWEQTLEHSAKQAARVLEICGRKGRIACVMQDNPDPDALASAYALRDLVWRTLKKRVAICYGGYIGRAENRAMMRVLHIEAQRLTPAQVRKYKTLCIVDGQPRAGNMTLLGDRTPEIVIDHHLIPKRRDWKADMEDLRPEYGATSTILYEYLVARGITLHDNVATALFYGIQSDTQDLGRETTPAGVRAYQELFIEADKRKLARIRRAPVSREYFQMLSDGLSECVVAGPTVISFIHECHNGDMLAEMADLLIRLEGRRTAVCYGVVDNMILLSARAADGRSNAAERMQKVVAQLGQGGGHTTMAGGQIPLNSSPQKRLKTVYERILKAFAGGYEPEPLTQEDKEDAAPGPAAARKAREEKEEKEEDT